MKDLWNYLRGVPTATGIAHKGTALCCSVYIEYGLVGLANCYHIPNVFTYRWVR